MANHQHSCSFYHNWMSQQRLDLEELFQALTNFPAELDYLRLLVNKNINHYEDYHVARAQLAKLDGPFFFAPVWGTTFENASLLIGGYRPSMISRFVYVLYGSQQTEHLVEFFEGVSRGDLGNLSEAQLKSIDALHAKIVKEEDRLTSIFGSLQVYI